MCGCVAVCAHACSACVLHVVGDVWGGCGACRWAMGEWWVTLHTPTMAISNVHEWRWWEAAMVSAVGVCGGVWVVQRRAQGCGAAGQAHLCFAAPAGARSGLLRVWGGCSERRLHAAQWAAAFGTSGVWDLTDTDTITDTDTDTGFLRVSVFESQYFQNIRWICSNRYRLSESIPIRIRYF